MLSKISNTKIIKGYIPDYSKIKDGFKEKIANDAFKWQSELKRENIYGMEGVWINHRLKQSIRIRWGKVYPSAIIYIEIEYLEEIKNFLSYYEIVEGMSTPNNDYDMLNQKNYEDLTVKSKESDKECQINILTVL